ncbi:MAG: DUF454 family protein [Wenzhouxiangellaceae bacterium]|nr:DUF454 family protein [Wenzhouxiangellaceae bacterium]
MSTPPARNRLGYRVLAVAAVGAGSLGIFLPLLPTTPLLLLALWAAARGAPDLHERIRRHPRFVITLDAWEHEGAVPKRAKWIACLLLLISWHVLWWNDAPLWLLIALGIGFTVLALFLLTRPNPKGTNPDAH